jgi:hypothetical protein
MPVNDRDRRALLWGGAIVAVLLLYLLLRGGNSGPPAERVQADIAATTPADQPATYAAPVQPQVVAAPVPVVTAPSVDASQLHLYGILSRGAVIGMADGTQRFVPVGREIVPGVTLRGVDVHHIILATPSGEVRLGFDNSAQPQPAAQPTP